MKKGMRIILPVLTIIAVLAFSVPASAATTADISITATPKFLSLTVTDSGSNTFAAGNVSTSSTYWYTSAGSAMTEPAIDADGKLTITSNSSISGNVKVHGHNFTGGVGWTISTTVGADTVVVGAFKTGDANKAAVLKLTTSDQEYIHEMTAGAHTHGGMYLDTGTFTDGVGKSTTVTYTIEEHT